MQRGISHSTLKTYAQRRQLKRIMFALAPSTLSARLHGTRLQALRIPRDQRTRSRSARMLTPSAASTACQTSRAKISNARIRILSVSINIVMRSSSKKRVWRHGEENDAENRRVEKAGSDAWRENLHRKYQPLKN